MKKMHCFRLHLSRRIDLKRLNEVWESVERALPSLLRRNIVLRNSISRQCLLYRSSCNPNTAETVEYCNPDSRMACAGQIRFCANPNALRQHFAKQGLGWEKNQGRRAGLKKKSKREPKADSLTWMIMDYAYRLPRPLLLLIALVMSSLGGLINHVVGPERSSSIFYFIPISVMTWFTKKWVGILMSIVCTLTWIVTDLASKISLASPNILYWNGITRLSSFLLFTFVLALLKTELIREKESSRVDSLTGVSNRRYFLELAGMEIEKARSERTPVSILYIDLDNFKLVNDRFGHSAGDNLLRLVANGIRNNIRETDIIARLGGDEFAILLPEIGPDLAHVIATRIEKINGNFLRENEWPVTLSMGVVTFVDPPQTVDDLLKTSDDLMYRAKKSGKNTICYEVYGKEHVSRLSEPLSFKCSSNRKDMKRPLSDEGPVGLSEANYH